MKSKNVFLALCLFVLCACGDSEQSQIQIYSPNQENVIYGQGSDKERLLVQFPIDVTNKDFEFSIGERSNDSLIEQEANYSDQLNIQNLQTDKGILAGLYLNSSHQFTSSIKKLDKFAYVRLPYFPGVSDSKTGERFSVYLGRPIPILIRNPKSKDTIYQLKSNDGTPIFGHYLPGTRSVEFFTDNFCIGECYNFDPRAYNEDAAGHAFDLMAGAVTWDEFPSSYDETSKMHIIAPIASGYHARFSFRSKWTDQNKQYDAYRHALWAYISLYGTQPDGLQDGVEEFIDGWNLATDGASSIDTVLSNLEAILPEGTRAFDVMTRLKSSKLLGILNKLGPILTIIECSKYILDPLLQKFFVVERDLNYWEAIKPILSESKLSQQLPFSQALSSVNDFVIDENFKAIDPYVTKQSAANCGWSIAEDLVNAIIPLSVLLTWQLDDIRTISKNHFLGSVMLTLFRDGGIEAWLDKKKIPWRVAAYVQCDSGGLNCVDTEAWDELDYAKGYDSNIWCNDTRVVLMALQVLYQLNEFSHEAEQFFIEGRIKTSDRGLSLLPGKQAYERWSSAEHTSKQLYQLRKTRYARMIHLMKNLPSKRNCGGIITPTDPDESRRQRRCRLFPDDPVCQ